MTQCFSIQIKNHINNSLALLFIMSLIKSMGMLENDQFAKLGFIEINAAIKLSSK